MVDPELLEQLYKDIGPRITKMLVEDVHAKGGAVNEVMLIMQGVIASLFLTYIKEESWEDCMQFFFDGVVYMLENGERISLENFFEVQKNKLN